MEDIKVYKRRRKEIKEENKQLHNHQNWVPETPVKPVLPKPLAVYTKRRLTINSGPSFLARTIKEAEVDKHVSVVASAVKEEGKEHESQTSEVCCLISDGSLDLNKPICDREDVAISVCDSNAAQGLVNLELSSYPSVAPLSEFAINNNESFVESNNQESQSAPPLECAANNNVTLPPNDEANDLESHATECDKGKDIRLEDICPVNHLEPQTPSIRHSKRPRNGKDSNVKPAKKKRHRPKVVVDCVPKRPVKNSPSKKEKTKSGGTSQPRKRNRKVIRKNLSATMFETLEFPSIHSTHDKVIAASDLNLETKSTMKSEVDENILVSNQTSNENISGVVHFDTERVLENSEGNELSFPKSCRKTRKKRKRRPKVSIVSIYFQIRSHVKKKRSRSLRRGTKMVHLASIDESVSLFDKLVSNDYPELESWSLGKSTGIQVGFNHEDIITNQGCKISSRAMVLHQSFLPIQEGVSSCAMVLHRSSLPIQEGAIVPQHDSSSAKEGAIVLHQRPLSKKFKPIIDLDAESMRRWILTKREEDGLDEEEEDVDDDTKRRWEEDMGLFKQRIDLFNKIMHEVLGDRGFKPWKGSVVDSVVGVFLTQNVSDFLSSSAYMTLAAKFPNRTSNHEEILCSQESTGSTNDLRGVSQYVVTESPSEEAGLCDIEDIGKPNFPRGINTENPLSSSKMMHETSFCGSSCGCHGDTFKITRDCPAENMIEEKTLPYAFVLPQDRSSEVENVTHKNLDFGCNSQVEIGLQKSSDSLDKQDKGPSSEAGKTTTHDKPHSEGEEQSTPRKKNVARKKEVGKKDWDSLRKKYFVPRNSDHTDSVDWEAVRHADVDVIAETIKSRGQHTILAERIKGFLNRVVELHGSIDLEWLRHAPPMIVKEYLLDVEGLGLKSVECIRLLELKHIAFPVDVNVARILVRVGWVPLKPLPGDLLFHLLEEYPLMDSVQKYVWPRLREFEPEILYQFHYHLITFGKVFCKKRSPNCNSCPLRAECRHFASAAAASANLHLPAPSNKDMERSLVHTPVVCPSDTANPNISVTILESGVTSNSGLEISNCVPSVEEPISPIHMQEFEDFRLTSDIELETSRCVPSIEEPKSPELVQNIQESGEVEDNCNGSNASLKDDEQEEEIPTVRLNNEVFMENVLFYWEKYRSKLQDGDGKTSKALVPSLVDVNSFSVNKLKRTLHLRTEHLVYEIPDDHELLIGLEIRDPEDTVPYLLAIWTAGETSNSVELPKKKCNSQGSELCDDKTCFTCRSICEGNDGIVRGTILIPCRTAMRGRFPLNGTYFQVNEVFADNETSHEPLIIPRKSVWYLKRRMVFFGTSPAAIFTSNCSLLDIQKNFWTGFICLRGFDRKTRSPQPLARRFHCSPSKMEKTPRKVNPNKSKSRFNQEKVNEVDKSGAVI